MKIETEKYYKKLILSRIHDNTKVDSYYEFCLKYMENNITKHRYADFSANEVLDYWMKKGMSEMSSILTNMNKISKKYSKVELSKKGIWIERLVNPETFNPYLIIYTKQNEEVTKEFEKDTTYIEIEEFIDVWIDKIIIKRRNEKITKILNK